MNCGAGFQVSAKHWLLRDRIVARPARFVAIASALGPLISSFLIVGPFFFGNLPETALAPIYLLTNVILFCLGSYVFGFLPALVASSILALRRNITVLEALVVALGVSFAAGALYGMLGLSNVPVYTGASLALIATPGTIGVGLLAAWMRVFAAPPPQASRTLMENAAT